MIRQSVGFGFYIQRMITREFAEFKIEELEFFNGGKPLLAYSSGLHEMMCTDNKLIASSRLEPGTIWPTSSRKRCSKLFHSNGIPNGEMSLVMYTINLK